ncbi:hypothetical protein PSQ40_05035 [Curvibacter sp. HBC61]|uniref:Uncharacterized protein n=1 Tax=Curvibacter cyanobacteriorum TaxID=3026422 RepID=A0ABT5MV56_9BURK|nr:hypothetical protein [Curvibacter sp. HBC61]MDD0837931.1 hypothetical protein [Curvibacter sp. HBC61]
MTPYTEQIRMTLPLGFETIAAAIGRALDPDVGGAESFRRQVTGYNKDETPIYGDVLTCSSLCTPEFKQQALAMQAKPELLHAACAADYAARWPDLTPPTLEDCQAFAAAVAIE